MESRQLGVQTVAEGAAGGIATRLHGVDVLAHHAQDPRPVLVPGGDIRLNGLVGQLVVGLDGGPIDRIEDRPLAPLEIGTPHSEGGHRIRDERRPRHERNFLPVNWCSLRSL